MSESASDPIHLKELSRKQRRVLGVLLEKGFTTPDQYPLTLKACTTGCNQKNNRDPLSNYDEDTVLRSLDELREIGLVGVLHTESGRTERYRHYMRHRMTLNEAQLAILTELMLRGKQQLGELRTRASRMVPIETLEVLRDELTSLQQQGLVRSNGSLDRRGAEVDHNLYPAGENREQFTPLAEETTESDRSSVPARTISPESSPTTPVAAAPLRSTDSSCPHEDIARLQAELARLQSSHAELNSEVKELRGQLQSVTDSLTDLRRQLGAG